jgi:hypothetical protein
VRVESARQQWDEGRRRLQAEAGDPVRYRQLCELVEILVAELRRSLGQRFSLVELAAAHARAEDWARDVVLDSIPPEPRVGIRDLPVVLDAAFHAFARGAVDYRP